MGKVIKAKESGKKIVHSASKVLLSAHNSPCLCGSLHLRKIQIRNKYVLINLNYIE